MAVERTEYGINVLQKDVEDMHQLLRGLSRHGLHTGDAVTYLSRKLSDASRQINNFYGYNTRTKALPMGDDIYEFRYEAHGDMYKLKCWHDGREDSMQGPLHTQPHWLTGIVDVAKVAGHLKTPISPPPEAILWFTTDKNRTLIEFIELS